MMRRRALLAASNMSGGNLIHFTIDNNSYQAEKGMTWGEWVDSEYNIDGEYYVASFDGSIMSGIWYVGSEEDYVYESDIIQDGYDYILIG